jgi:integrase
MAFIVRHPESKYWHARFLLPNSKRYVQRSTKTTDRRLAQKLADLWELPARKVLMAAQHRKVIAEGYQLIHGELLPGTTIKEFLADWLKRRQAEIAPATSQRYCNVTKQFTDYLGEQAAKEIQSVTVSNVIAFRDSLLERLSATSANVIVKILRVIFEEAKRDGLITENVFQRVKSAAQTSEKVAKRAFTMAELQKIYKAANPEWKGMIICGLTTAQRLKDIAMLQCANVDLKNGLVTLITAKTGRRQILPLHRSFRSYLSLQKNRKPADPLFPAAHAKVAATGRSSRLSEEFHKIMLKSGLVERYNHTATGKGRSVKRQVREISFHSLRHTATSMMKNAGISAPIVQDLVGHDSAAISAHYTHIDEAAKKRALEAIPDLRVLSR